MQMISNKVIADRLLEYADVLEQQQANRFRITAYQRAADTIAGLKEELRQVYDSGGTEALITLPNIGKGIASAIVELVKTGRWTRLERLRGALDPEKLFQTVSSIGPTLAQRIHDELGVDTLEELELAAHDGRLQGVSGIDRGRAQIIRSALDAMLARPRAAFHLDSATGPAVATILEVNREYRDKAARGELPAIAPRRFNPDRITWLPVLHTRHDKWHFTALFSNTARAHQLDRTRDWVVIYFYNDHHEEGQHTVVTETHGPLKGERVVRGRELECRDLYLTTNAV